MDMRDASNGALLWESERWGAKDMLKKEMTARLPQKILSCRAVSRELNFTSAEEIKAFRLEQRVFLNGACLEGEEGSKSGILKGRSGPCSEVSPHF